MTREIENASDLRIGHIIQHKRSTQAYTIIASLGALTHVGARTVIIDHASLDDWHYATGNVDWRSVIHYPEPPRTMETNVATRDGLVFPALYDKDINQWLTRDGDVIQSVAYWMPMPEAP